MLIAKILPVLVIFIVGFLPFLIITPLTTLTSSIFNLSGAIPSDAFFKPMLFLSASAATLLAMVVLIILIRRLAASKNRITSGPTWGCGYTSVNARQQYTATSFIQEYASLSKPVIRTGHSNITYGDEEIFPGKRDFHTGSDDFIRSNIINRPSEFIVNLLRRAAVFQTGRLQHYVLYVLLFLLIIFLLTFLKLI
jgi:hypothetical protein